MTWQQKVYRLNQGLVRIEVYTKIALVAILGRACNSNVILHGCQKKKFGK